MNPGTVYWMDMTFVNIDLLLKFYCLFEKTENKRKIGRLAHLKTVHFIIRSVKGHGGRGKHGRNKS